MLKRKFKVIKDSKTPNVLESLKQNVKTQMEH